MSYEDIIKREDYLFILSNGEAHYTNHNTGFHDAIIDVAGQTGTNTPLFLKAFKSMETDEEMIELYNRFSSNQIKDVYKIQIETVVYSDTTNKS